MATITKKYVVKRNYRGMINYISQYNENLGNFEVSGVPYFFDDKDDVLNIAVMLNLFISNGDEQYKVYEVTEKELA